jgi:hypothetical protein
MSTSIVDTDLIARICRQATARSGHGTVLDATHDPLDGSTWVRLSSWPRARESLTALNAHGIAGRDLEDCRLHVTGWDVRLLHRRLGILLAGIDDLQIEWDATAELVCYHHDRRINAGIDPDPADILADVETTMRSCVPIPHRAPRFEDVARMLDLIAAAEDAYQQLIAEHVDYAERILAARVSARLRDGAA